MGQGHHVEAEAAFAAFQALTRLKLGVDPSEDLTGMMAGPGKGPYSVGSRPTAMAT